MCIRFEAKPGNRPNPAARSVASDRTPTSDRFCSARCKQVDLGRWLGGDYRLPTEEVAKPEELIAALSAGEDPPPER